MKPVPATPEKIFGRFARYFDFGTAWDDVFENIAGRSELAEPRKRDAWQNWDFQLEPSKADVERASIDLQYRTKEKVSWPNGAPFVVCITHDIDTLSLYSVAEYVTRFRRADLKGKIRAVLGFIKHRVFKRSRLTWDFEAWLRIEEKYGAKATWFVFPDTPTKSHPDDCRYRLHDRSSWSTSESLPLKDALLRLVAKGHEIGLHGSILAADDAEELGRQRRDFEATLGRPIHALRMHYLRYDPMESPARIEQAGFKIDSTLGYNTGIGFRRGTAFPFININPQTNHPTTVWEVPLIIQEGALLRDWCLGLTLEEAKERTLTVFDDVEKTGGVLTLVFHPHSFDDPSVIPYFSWLLAEAKRRRAWMPTLSDVISHIEA